jgi:predicted GH43/DUF377 family glycosyl hydrolase
MIIHAIDKRHLLQHMPLPDALYRDRCRVIGAQHVGPNRFYNPSVLRVGEKTWMAYRADIEGHWHLTVAAACTLNSEWNPEPGSNRYMVLPTRFGGFCVEDPRLFAVQDSVYVSYTDGRRVALARLDAHFGVDDAWYCETDFRLQSVEKNWAFFGQDYHIRVVYSVKPHVVMPLDFENERPFSSKAFVTDWPFQWEYGTPRGGSAPVLHNGHFWHFFHSYLPLENDARRYYGGVYLFESEPPFKPVAICAKPIMVGTSENLPPQGTFQVVFPAGAVRGADQWHVAFGRNDYDCCIAHIPDDEIELTWL